MLEAAHNVILGRTGSGKTIFVRRFCLNAAGVACRFVFDWNDRFTFDWQGRKLPFPVAHTAAQLEASLPSRSCIFNPSRMFPGAMFDRKTGLLALRYFASFVRNAAKRGPGRKLFAVAELWNFCTEDSIPAELAMLAQDGRSDGVEFVFDTQRPEKLNPSIIGAATEIVCFRLDEKQALKAVAAMGHDPEAVRALPFGSFISRDLKGGEVRGRVF